PQGRGGCCGEPASEGHSRVRAKDSRDVDPVLTQAEQLREQRDRFLAFAFAASDLLLEIGDDSQIRYVVGATKQLLGGPPAAVIGRGWLELFAPEDHPLLVAKVGALASGKRCGPVLVSLVPGLPGAAAT